MELSKLVEKEVVFVLDAKGIFEGKEVSLQGRGRLSKVQDSHSDYLYFDKILYKYGLDKFEDAYIRKDAIIFIAPSNK